MGAEIIKTGDGKVDQIVRLRAAKANKTLEREKIAIIENFKFPAYNEIPDVGLYLEQTGKYINGFLSPILGTDLTGSMISNYVKQKIIPNPEKKQYYRDHIVDLIFINVAKTILSLDNIKNALDMMVSNYDHRTMYEKFCGIFEDTLKNTFHFIEEKPKKQEPKDSTVMRYLSAAVSYKIYLDNCFDISIDEDNSKK